MQNDNHFFDLKQFKLSQYPGDFIPKGCKMFYGLDTSEGKDCSIIGFYLNGICHIKEVKEDDLMCKEVLDELSDEGCNFD